MTFTVEIAVPPSANNMFLNVPKRGRVKSNSYASWRRGIALQIQAAVRPSDRVGGKIDVTIDLPRDLVGDLDNRIKPILDCLVASGRIDDDRHVVGIVARKSLSSVLARITVTPARAYALAGGATP